MSPSQHKTQPGSRTKLRPLNPDPGHDPDNPGPGLQSGRTCDAGPREHAAQSAAPAPAQAGPATRAAPRVHCQWAVGPGRPGVHIETLCAIL
jgi:hypothetical protein